MLFRKVITFATGDRFEVFLDLVMAQKANSKLKIPVKFSAKAYVDIPYGEVLCECRWQDTERMALNGCYKEARKLLAAQVRAKLQATKSGSEPTKDEVDDDDDAT